MQVEGLPRITGRESKNVTDKPVEELKTLTPRETEVFSLIAQGFSNKEIGNRLFVAEKSVENHINNILRKVEKVGIYSASLDDKARVQCMLLFQRNTPDFVNPVSSYFEDYEIKPLTPRQKEVVTLIGEGCSNLEIAVKLNLSIAVVANYINSILNQKIPVDRETYNPRVVLALISQTEHVV